MPQQEEFQKAAEEVKVLRKKPSDAELGELYGLYKQVMVGDVNTGESRSRSRSWVQITWGGLSMLRKVCRDEAEWGKVEKEWDMTGPAVAWNQCETQTVILS